MLEIVEKEGELVLVVADQVKYEILLQTLVKTTEKAIFLLQCPYVVLEPRVYILQHHLNLALFQRSRALRLGHLHQEEFRCFQ